MLNHDTTEIFRTTSFLVVDDISAMRSAVKMLLTQLGAVTIHQATNGADALKLLDREKIDVVLSDWNMPVMTGIELLDRLRTAPTLAHLPFILITAETSRDQIQKAIEAGVGGILVKPFTVARLAERVLRVLGHTAAGGPAHVLPGPAAAASSARIDRATVLVVDDTPENLHLIAGIMKEEYRIKAANNGETALAICQSETPPDLVLLDIMMPGMDGFEVARRLREHPASEHIPVIFVTAMTDEESQAKGAELGAVDFITKPINPDALKIRVRNFMRYIDLRRQLQADYDGMLENARLRDSVESMTRHDLKGPLSGIVGIAQSLGCAAELPAEAAEKLRAIESTALDVIDMVTRSTELYKIESGTFRLEPTRIEIPDLIRQQVDLIAGSFATKELRSAVQTLGSAAAVSGDPLLCRSLFQNLLKNAWEAAPNGSEIGIEIAAGDMVEIRITNGGVVPADIRDRFFDKFATSGKTRGSGLGTYSAKLMTEAQKGRIEVSTSDEKNQTTVTVALPAS